MGIQLYFELLKMMGATAPILSQWLGSWREFAGVAGRGGSRAQREAGASMEKRRQRSPDKVSSQRIRDGKTRPHMRCPCECASLCGWPPGYTWQHARVCAPACRALGESVRQESERRVGAWCGQLHEPNPGRRPVPGVLRHHVPNAGRGLGAAAATPGQDRSAAQVPGGARRQSGPWPRALHPQSQHERTFVVPVRSVPHAHQGLSLVNSDTLVWNTQVMCLMGNYMADNPETKATGQWRAAG